MTKTAILITNLGTPSAPTVPAVRKYLNEFLSDPYVVEIPKWIWKPLLKMVVAPLRAPKSAAAYQKIWTPEGSPHLNISTQITRAMAQQLGNQATVELAMRYGQPSLRDVLAKLHSLALDQLIVLPLYPQYAYSTTASTFATISQIIKNWRYVPRLNFINDYFDQPLYIEAIAQSIEQHWQKNGQRYLLFSFHGLPENSIAKGDPYYQHCLKTAQLVTNYLQLSSSQWQIVFQSRFGKQSWLKPYCEQTLKTLPQQGIKAIDIICPGFPADCLETLEEIAIRNKTTFLQAGGEVFHYIPALNDNANHIQFLISLIQDFLKK